MGVLNLFQPFHVCICSKRVLLMAAAEVRRRPLHGGMHTRTTH